MRKGQFTINYAKDFRDRIKKNFGTEDELEIKKIVLEFLENGDAQTLSLKDQLLLERIQKIREQRPLQLKKLELQNQLLQQRIDFQLHFKVPLSNEGSQTLQTETKKKYGFATSPNVDENIQLKKNFFINKINSGEFCGVCKVCQNFTTDICSTSQEAEGDIELHLESIHQRGLYQR